MTNNIIDEETKLKSRLKTKQNTKTYGLEFVPSQETIDAIIDAKKQSMSPNGGYMPFSDLREALMLDED